MMGEKPNDSEVDSGRQESWLRPQSVIFTLLAEHLLDRDLPALFAGSFIEALERVGVTEHATRATLARMHERGLLDKQRQGRKTFFQMTPRCVSILEGGRERIWLTGAVNRERAEGWTLVAFSLPESWQRKRYDLRSRLTWAGFGPLQNGLWLAPQHADVVPILEQLELLEHARVFHAQSVLPADPAKLVSEAFDLTSLAQNYRDFIDTWAPLLTAGDGASGAHAREQSAPDPLVLTLRLSTQWLRLIGADPRVPVQLLPEDWPAAEAQRVFRQLHEHHREAARQQADALFELAVEPAPG